MEKEHIKEAVLAKCQEAKDSRDKWIPVGDNGSGLACEYFTDALIGYFQIGSPHHSICLKFNEETHSESYVWPLAAQILQIPIEQPTTRPSDALLWEAYFEAAKMFIGKAGVNYGNIAEIANAEFTQWLATLPADTIKADRELALAAVGDGKNEFKNHKNHLSPISYDVVLAIRRLAGMEVGHES
jgi:hypothetical protein